MTFKLSELPEDDAIDLLQSLLSNGIPPSALALSFNIDPEFVRGIAAEIRVRRYGTAEIAEAMTWLMWEAYDEAVSLLHTGSPANRIRAVAMILPRSVGMAARQDPEVFGQIRQQLEDMMNRETSPPGPEDPGEFVITP
jgi:hypothetical protein